MTASIESKVSLLIESTLLDKIYISIKRFFINDSITEADVDIIVYIINFWFSRTKEFNFKKIFFDKKFKKFFTKNKNDIKNQTSKPEFLYRGMYFNTEKDRELVLKDFKKNGIKRASEPFASWTSDKEAVKLFLPNKKWRQYKYGILIKVPYTSVENNIVFSFEPYINSEAKQKKFTKLLLDNFGKKIQYFANKKEFTFNKNELSVSPQLLVNTYLIHEYILNTVPINTYNLLIQHKDLK